ncbi:MAG: hypothetical protein ACFNYB_03895, partial [Campylobacter sp.]
MKKFVTKRYFTFFIITIAAIILPFLKFGGNHFFLLSFDKSALHLFFVKFDMQELYLLPFLFIFVFFCLQGVVLAEETQNQTLQTLSQEIHTQLENLKQ